MKSTSNGWLNGLVGVIIFSGSMPATRIAVAQIDPIFLTGTRASLAGLLALVLLRVLGAPRPSPRELISLASVAACIAVGFPLLTALALQHINASRSLVFLGLLPLSTALFGVLRAGERPPPRFWMFAALGSFCVAAFAWHGGAAGSALGDSLMLGAIVSCGYGYAEGARLSRTLGGWQVICWALVVALPFAVVLATVTRPASWQQIGAPAWWALGYVTLFSMLIGFFFWYRGLAQGGIASVSQLQLLQPFMGLGLAAALLHETIDPSMLIATLAVVGCVAAARRFAGRPAPSVEPPAVAATRQASA